MQLYMNDVATTSRAVVAFLAEAGVAAELRSVDLMSGETHSPEFRAVNPNGMVPVLDDDGFVLTEASAILRYLAAKHASPLYPTDLRERARVDEMIDWFGANFYKDFGFQLVYPQFFPNHSRGSDEVNAAVVAFAWSNTGRWLTVLDQHYLRDGQLFLAGNRLTISDFFGASILSLGELIKFDLSPFPRVLAWYNRIKSIPSWRKASATFDGFVASLGAPKIELDLPVRRGPRPRTTDEIPHRQISDNPDPVVFERMKAKFLHLQGTEVGASLISVPGATALFVPEDHDCNPEAFLTGREFAHIHPAADGSFHMMLPPSDAELVVERGWGEQHLWARTGRLPANTVMIYAPRDDAEIEVVLQIVNAAHRFARKASATG